VSVHVELTQTKRTDPLQPVSHYKGCNAISSSGIDPRYQEVRGAEDNQEALRRLGTP